MRVWSMWETPAFPGVQRWSFFNVGAAQSTTMPVVFPSASAQARLLTRAFRWHLEVDATQAWVTVHSASPDTNSPNTHGRYVWSVSAGHPFDATTHVGLALVGRTLESVGWPYLFLLDEQLWPDWAPKDNQLLDLMASAGAARRWVRPPPRSYPDSTRLDFPADRPPPLPFDERAAPFFHAHDDLYVSPATLSALVDGLDGRYAPHGVVSDVAALQTALGPPGGLQGDVTALQSAMTTAQTDIGTLKSAMTTAQTDISGLRTDVTTLQGVVATVQVNVAALQAATSSTLDVASVNPPFALLTLASLPALTARLAARGIAVNVGNIGRVKLAVTAAEMVTATGALVRVFPAYTAPTQFGGGTFRWPILVWDAALGAAVGALVAGNQLSLTVTAYVT